MGTVEVEWVDAQPTPAPALTGNGAVVVKFDYPAEGAVIGECRGCMNWSAQVIVEDGQVLVREWHNVDCDILPTWRYAACHGELQPSEYCPRCGAYNPGSEPA